MYVSGKLKLSAKRCYINPSWHTSLWEYATLCQHEEVTEDRIHPTEVEWCLMVGKWKKLFTFFLFAHFCSPLTLKESNYRNEITKKLTLTSSGISQKEKEKHCMISIICRLWKEMIPMNLFTKQKQTYRLREWIFGYQKRSMGEGIVTKFGINMYTLPCLKV